MKSGMKEGIHHAHGINIKREKIILDVDIQCHESSLMKGEENDQHHIDLDETDHHHVLRGRENIQSEINLCLQNNILKLADVGPEETNQHLALRGRVNIQREKNMCLRDNLLQVADIDPEKTDHHHALRGRKIIQRHQCLQDNLL